MNKFTRILVLSMSLAVPVAANAQSSWWKMTEERDRMTDEMLYLAMTQARDSSQFVIQCTKDYIAAFVKLQYLDMDICDERKAWSEQSAEASHFDPVLFQKVTKMARQSFAASPNATNHFNLDILSLTDRISLTMHLEDVLIT